MPTIRAIYENGVFRPLEPVDLPDGCRVKLHILSIEGAEPGQNLDAIYDILDRRHSTGERDLAERHNEHQP
ncbi:MAG: antitoxin family protein [Pirellulales bacterium]